MERIEARATVIGSLKRDEGGSARFTTALSGAHVEGAPVGWTRVFEGTGAKRVPLPTYAFQRRPYWLQPAPPPADAAGLGLAEAGHPLLGAAVRLAGEEGLMFTGVLSTVGHPWLADHAVAATILLPGTALLDLVLHAGATAGCPEVTELVLEAPLPLSRHGNTVLQVHVNGPDQSGRRQLSVHARPEDGQEWTRHADIRRMTNLLQFSSAFVSRASGGASKNVEFGG